MHVFFKESRGAGPTSKNTTNHLLIIYWHFIAEISLPAWQKEIRNITYEVIEAMKETKKYETGLRRDVMHEIFLPRHM